MAEKTKKAPQKKNPIAIFPDAQLRDAITAHQAKLVSATGMKVTRQDVILAVLRKGLLGK